MTKWLLCLLLAVLPARSAWLEGIRWFRHDSYVRVVFDVSAPCRYQVSEHLAEGYVDVILQGELTRRMAEEIAIEEGGVLSARQLRKTSTALTWRISVQGVAKVRHMSVEEQPYKVALDFYPGSAGAKAAAKPAEANGKLAAKPAEAHGKPAAKPAEAHGKPAAKPAEAHGKPAAKPAEAHGKPAAKPAEAHGKPAAHADKAHAPQVEIVQAGKTPSHEEPVPDVPVVGGTGESRLEGLAPDQRRRVLVGELLLQLGDSAGAMAYLEQVQTHSPGHAWTRFLLAQAYLSKGDQYRAERLLEPIRERKEWQALLEPVLQRLQKPDARGVVPGGDISEEDLGYYLGVLRQGAGLSTKDLYAKPEPAKAGGGGAFKTGLALSGGALLGALVFLGLEWRRRRQQQELDRLRILSEDIPRRPAPLFDEPDGQDYSEAARRVREELDQVLHHEPAPTAPASFDFARAGAEEPQGELSLEERVYQLADEKRSIVEIAEELNLGVDEVRLHLELREQAGRITND